MIVVFDMGATNTRVASSADGQTLGPTVVFDTLPDYDAGFAKLADTIKQVASSQPIDQIIGGIAGTLALDHQQLERSTYLPDWVHQPITEQLAKQFSCRVLLQNDAALVGLGEANNGAGQGHQIMAYLTVSSGINGVRIIDGQIDHQTWGFELGYQIIGQADDGQPVRLGTRVSGRSVEQRFGQAPGLVKDPAIWEQLRKELAIGVHNTILHWSPEIIVFGGSMMRDIPLDLLQTDVQALLIAYPQPPQFIAASLGETGGLYGALVYSSQQS